LCLHRTTFDCVFDAIEEELLAQEPEDFFLDTLGYVRLEVEQIKVQLVVDSLAFLSEISAKCLGMCQIFKFFFTLLPLLAQGSTSLQLAVGNVELEMDMFCSWTAPRMPQGAAFSFLGA
jgi:hypothetical protein